MSLPKWLVNALVTGAASIVLSGSAWAVKTVIADGNRLTAVETRNQDILERLGRIEDKLDDALRRR